MPLSVKRVAKFLSIPGRHSDGGNLFLEVRSPTNAYWLFRWERRGRKRELGLGSAKTFNLHEARERARRCRQMLADGIEPALKEKPSKTFQRCAEEAFPAFSKGWRNAKHIAGWHNRTKRYIFPVIGNLDVNRIDVDDVLKVLNQDIDGETFWEALGETAARSRADIERVLGWATVRGLRKGDNPGRWRGFLETQLGSRSRVKHHAALPHADVPQFMAELRAKDSIGAKALEFLILTATRTGAVIGATWHEIDFENKIWSVPAGRSGAKTDKPRRVPLSGRAVEILKSLPCEHGNDFIFIGSVSGRGISNMTMTKVLRVMKRQVTTHGFRSTFKTWATECTDVENIVSEAALWHSVSDSVERAYRRGDLFEKRKQLMEDWACFAGSSSP